LTTRDFKLFNTFGLLLACIARVLRYTNFTLKVSRADGGVLDDMALCAMRSAQCALRNALSSLRSAHGALLNALCSMRSAQGAPLKALCSWRSAQCA